MNLTVDEMMIVCCGRSSETVRMKNKTIAAGFKMWALAEADIVYHSFPHSNRYSWRHTGKHKGNLLGMSAVVATLVDCLPQRLSVSTMYHIFMDNLFYSEKLLGDVYDRKVACTVTTCRNTTGFPGGP